MEEEAAGEGGSGEQVQSSLPPDVEPAAPFEVGAVVCTWTTANSDGMTDGCW